MLKTIYTKRLIVAVAGIISQAWSVSCLNTSRCLPWADKDITVRSLEVINVTLQRSYTPLCLFEGLVQVVYLTLHLLSDLCNGKRKFHSLSINRTNKLCAKFFKNVTSSLSRCAARAVALHCANSLSISAIWRCIDHRIFSHRSFVLATCRADSSLTFKEKETMSEHSSLGINFLPVKSSHT